MKLIVVTGGVLSGLGKGVAAASIGRLLSSEYRVVPIKCDGYLNVDPGTMNPFEHGEVFVLDDGAEVDMDFGHYERFLGVRCRKEHSLTMGRIYDEIRLKERRGDFLGKTVQLLPHVVDHIKETIRTLGQDGDVTLLEIGGTVGDMEAELYYEAARQLAIELGKENALFVHLTYVPKPAWTGEHKTKPTQQSVQLLLQRGIIPDVIITRSAEPVDDDIKEKIRMFTGVSLVVSGHDLPDVYDIPRNFHEQGLLDFLNQRLRLSAKYDPRWEERLHALANARRAITIGIAGKYTTLEDSYASIVEALKHCSAHLGVRVALKWIDTTDLSDASDALDGIDGVIVPGGFGDRGIEGKIAVIKECREKRIPFLGICYGMQLAVVEFARNVCGLEGANTTEVDPKTPHPVIDILPEQLEVSQKGGTMRLGACQAELRDGIIRALYKSTQVSERHRHRFEVNPDYHDTLEEHGMVFAGMNGRLVEFIELPGHPYFVGTQAHPELKSSLDRPAPLFMGLVSAASRRHG